MWNLQIHMCIRMIIEQKSIETTAIFSNAHIKM